MKYRFIAARFFAKNRKGRIRLIVWHDMEAPEAHETAENVANWWHGPDSPKSSANVCVDDDSAVECVHLSDVAYHAPGANHDGAGIELAGHRDQGHAGWRDTFSLATIRRACQWILDKPELAHIPDRWLTDAQLADGLSEGHTTHDQVTRVFKKSTHTDPGPDFPRDYVMEQLAALRAVHAHSISSPLPTMGEPDMVVIYAPGKATALLAAGRLISLASNAEKDALSAAGVPVKGITTAQYALIEEVAKR